MTITSLNWFDAVATVLLIMLAIVGYKRGAAEDLLPTVQWWTIVFTAAYTHRPLGEILRKASGFGLATCYVVIYMAELGVLLLLFRWIKDIVTERIVAAQLFRKTEHVIGFIFGALKSAAIITLVVAVVHIYDMSAPRTWLQKHDNDPTFQALALTVLERIQRDIALDSLCGKILRQKAPYLLTAPVPVRLQLRDDTGTIQERRRILDQSGQGR